MRKISFRLWLLCVFSGLLQLLPFAIAGPVPQWRRLFCWICLVPLLYALLAKNKSGTTVTLAQGVWLSYACGVLWYAGNCYWIYQTMHIYGNIPQIPSFGILVLFSLYLGLYHALFGGLLVVVRARISTRVALIAAPFLWVAVELARARVTAFPWDLLGYTQVDNAVLTTLAPLGGVMLLSFVIAAANAAVVYLLPGIGRRSWRWAILVGGAILLLQAGSFYHPAADDAGHVATLLQENLAVGAEGRDLVPYPMAKKYEDFTRLSLNPEHDKSGVLAHPELIVWPEAPAEFITSDPQFRVQLSNLARTAHEPVIVGSVGVDFDPASERGYHEFGSAAVFGSDSSFLGRYDKIHRVPWGEYVPYKQFFGFAGQLISGVGNMEAGTEHKLFRLNDHNVGIFICYESIFGDEVRQFVRNGAELLVNISDDGWYGDSGAPWQHLDMARMRAIENRRWVLRDTNTGITTAIDPHGRGIFTTPRHVRSAFDFGFGYRSSVTMYTLHGDWFAWSCVAVVAGFILWPLGAGSARYTEAYVE